jgi:hypothetical protein
MEDFDGEDSKAVPLEQVELEKNYALVISTNSGLWRYLIGDTIKFTSLSPYRIKITGRTKHFINVFGEELMVENAEEALEAACKSTNAQVADFTVAPIFMEESSSGGHEWLIEFREQPDDLHLFIEKLDEALKSLNSDYEAKRYMDMTIRFPKVNVARQGQFYSWLKSKNKLGGQHKVPRLSNKRDYLEELMRL